MAFAGPARLACDTGRPWSGRWRALAACLATLALVACHGGGGDDPQAAARRGEIRVSILSRPGRDTERAWRPILADMQTDTGLSVKPTFSSDPTTLVAAMKAKKTDVGLFSNASGLAAVRGGGGEVFARGVDAFGSDGYRSILVVNARSPLTLERVLRCDKTLVLAMGDRRSMSGALAPIAYLFGPRGIRLKDCFKAVRAGGDAQSNLAQAASRQADLATSSSFALRLGRRAASRLADQVRVIWQSPPLPEDPLVWRRDLDPALKETVRQFFLTYGQGATPQAVREQAALTRIDVGGFRPADDTHLLPYQEMAATQAWLLAKEGRDPGRIAVARRILDAITARRLALEARTREPAGAQP